jgi:phosphatidylinositol alpha-mannosyltransferase
VQGAIYELLETQRTIGYPERHDRPTAAKLPHSREVTGAPLKIGIVTEHYYPVLNEVSESVHFTATELVARGHAVRIVSPTPWTNGAHAPQPNGIPVRRIGQGVTPHVTVGAHLWRDLAEVLRAERFDILQVHSPLLLTLPPLATLLATCPRVGSFHDTSEHSPVYAAFRRVIQHQLVDRLDGATVSSPRVLGALGRYFDLDARVIPSGVDTDRFNPRVPRLTRFGTEKRTLLFLNQPRHRQGLSFMLRLFSAVRRRFADVRLIVAGTGSLRQADARLLPDDVRDDVRFEEDALLNRASYYATADLLCAPIGSPSYALLEAMACGTPIVAADTASHQDLVGPAEGVLVSQDVDAFADAIVQLLNDDRLRIAMSEGGLRKAAAHSWPTVVSRLLEYFQDIIDG